MNGVMKKLAALVLAVAMITTFTPLYGAGAAYAQDEQAAAQQDVAAENADPDVTGSGEDLAPETGTEVTGTEGAEDASGETAGEEAAQGEEAAEAEIPESGEEQLQLMKAPLADADTNGDEGGEGDGEDPFAGVHMAGLEGPNIIFNDGLTEYKLTDQDALNVAGVTHYEAFVGVPAEGPWDAIDSACYSYNDSTKTVTIDGRILEQKHPEYQAKKRLAVQILGLDDDDNFKMIATKMDIEFWPAYSGYDFPEDRQILPGWDGTINGQIHYYEENCEHPDGHDMELNVTAVDVIEGRALLEDWHADSNTDNHWWYYRAGWNMGNVTFRLTYEDADGSTKTHDVHVTVGSDVYEVNVHIEGNFTKLLPGQEVTIQAWPGRNYWNGDHGDYTTEGLKLEWSLARNDQNAGVLTVDPDDPGKAVLSIREPADGEEINAGIQVKVAVTDENDPGVEKCSEIRWFDASQDFYDIYPNDMNVSMPLGQIVTQKCELHHMTFRDGNASGEIIPVKRAKFDFNNQAFRITKEGSADTIAPGEEVTGADTFTIQRIGSFGTDMHLTLWGDNGSDEVGATKRYSFDDMGYDMWFDKHDQEIFTDTQNDPQLRLDVGSFTAGGDIDENFKFTITAGEWDYDTDKFVSMIPQDAITAVRSGNELVITFDRTKIGLDDGNKNIRVVVEAASKFMDWSMEKDAYLHIREAQYVIHTESHMEMLPGWDRNLDWIDVYVQNEDHPDGEDFSFPVNNVTVVWGAEHLDEMPTAENGWYFRAKDAGQVVFDLAFDNEYGVEEHFTVEVNITGEVYEVSMETEGPFDHGLPGSILNLQAHAVHKFIDDKGRYHEDSDGLVFEWAIEHGGEYATLTPDSSDPTRAVLRFNEMPEGRDSFSENIGVVVKVKDSNNDPAVERGASRRDFWVASEYTEVWPTGHTELLGIGKSTGSVKYEVRRYSVFGPPEEGYKDGYKTYDIDSAQWFFNEKDLTITDGDGREIHDGDRVDSDTFDILKKVAWGTDANIHVWYNEDGRTEECDSRLRFDDLNYDLWLDSIDDNVYIDNDCIMELQTNEAFDYSALDIRYVVGFYDWNEEEQEDHWIDAPQDCYSVSDDRMSVTISGAAMAEHGIEELKIKPEAWYDGELIREGDERTVWLRESCSEMGEEHLWLASLPEYTDCESPGTQKMMCWNCHEKKVVIVPPRGHSAKVVSAKAATATAEGRIKHWKCSFCGKCYTDSALTKEISEDGTKIPKGISLSKVTPQKKGFTAAWKAPTGTDLAHTSGYQIMYALNSKFTSGKKTVTISSPKTASKKVTSLKAGKKYYVKIRKYRTISGKKYYSPWSKAKTVTTKK